MIIRLRDFMKIYMFENIIKKVEHPFHLAK